LSRISKRRKPFAPVAVETAEEAHSLCGVLASPDYSRLLVVTRFIGSDQSESDEDRMNAVTTNGDE